jgi:U3 small nucleolar RNA-associated protein 12
MAVLVDNNAVEEYEIGQDADGVVAEEPTRTRVIDAQGHRADIRAVALSPDDATLITCSHKGVKVWNPMDGSCLRSIDGGYGLCAAFAPGGRHAVVGCKSGALEIIDTQAGTALCGMKDAHGGAVWGVALLPDGSGFVTASADKTVKFFEWRLVDVEEDEDDEGEGRRELGIAHVKTLQMAEDVLSVKVTPDGKLLSVSLLDNTLKVFFVDSLKFFLSLYGHRLPALCHDVSSDSQLLASGGADKNIRIWGLDFGDCHRSVFAHEDSVTSIAFVPKTHYLFSTGKDRLVKYWDADKFEPLLTLQGHHASAWCIALSARGEFAVTGGHDRAIRVWERTDEPFFVDEEKEKRLESLLEEGGAEDDGDDDRIAAAARENASAKGGVAPAGAEAGMAGRKTLETLTAADQIVDALDVAGHERTRIDDHVRANGDKDAGNRAGNGDDQEDEEELRKALDEFSDEEDDDEDEDDDDDVADAVVVGGASLSAYGHNPSYPSGLPPNPLLQGQSPERYALSAIEKVRAADLEQAVLALPFSSALTLLDYLGGWLEAGEKTELTCRLASLIVRLHYVQLGATHKARAVLLRLRPLLRKRAAELRDMMGFNLAGMNMWETHLKEGGGGTKKDDDDDENVAQFTDELIKDEDAPGLPGWG